MTPTDKIAYISEDLCIGCGICAKVSFTKLLRFYSQQYGAFDVANSTQWQRNDFKPWICLQKCPFEAISIINLPSNLEKDTTHRYSANSFKLHRYAALHILFLNVNVHAWEYYDLQVICVNGFQFLKSVSV